MLHGYTLSHRSHTVLGHYNQKLGINEVRDLDLSARGTGKTIIEGEGLRCTQTKEIEPPPHDHLALGVGGGSRDPR